MKRLFLFVLFCFVFVFLFFVCFLATSLILISKQRNHTLPRFQWTIFFNQQGLCCVFLYKSKEIVKAHI